jgi:hypothetical protein
MERNGVEVQIERRAVRETQPGHGIEPGAHQLRITGRRDARTVLGEERPLGDYVQPGEQRQPFVEHRAHDMRVPRGAEQLQRQQAPQRVSRRDHLGARQIAGADHPLERHLHQCRQKQKQAAEVGPHAARFQIQLAHVGAVGLRGSDALRTFLVRAARQAREAFLLEHGRHRHGRSQDVFFLQGRADIVDGQVLLAQQNDLTADRLGGLHAGTRRRREELPLGVSAELMDQLMKTPDRVAKASGDVGPRQLLNEISPQGFVLSVAGVLWGQKGLGQIH